MDFPSRRYQPNLAPASLPQLGRSQAEPQHPPVQQAYGPHHIGDRSTLAHQAQYSGGQAVDLRFHAQQSSGQFTVQPNRVQHDAGFYGQNAPVSALTSAPAIPPSHMAPPTQPRKRKAPTLREADWEPYKARILDLHTAQRLSLSKVKQVIEEESGFKAEYVAPPCTQYAERVVCILLIQTRLQAAAVSITHQPVGKRPERQDA